MAVAFTRVSYWLWGGKDRETPNSSLNGSTDFPSGFREPDSVKFPTANVSRIRSRRVRRKWQSREERRIDKEYDIVLVPSDGVCMSESESSDSDWSIGWLEPHGPEFENDTETENSFAVLVPCYGRGRGHGHGRSGRVESHKNRPLGEVDYVNDDLSDGKKYIEELLSSL